MREIHYIQQPTEYLCGQACVAMLAGVSVDDVIRVMNNDKATGKKDIERALDHYGIKQAKTMTKADNHILVLGAFGCGAFNNPPELVAGCFRYCLVDRGYRDYFKRVVFAIKGGGRNYAVFRDNLTD